MKSKLWKKAALALFVAAMLMNLTLSFDSAGQSSSDLTLGSLNLSLAQKAYGYTYDTWCSCVQKPGYACDCFPGYYIVGYKVIWHYYC
jgi:hypothetical protein